MTDGDGATRTATTTLNVIATTPPSPAFMAAPNPVVAGQPVTFDAGASTDDGTIVRYEWDLDGNGSYETDGGASPLVTRSFPNATVMSIGVRATDDDGRTAVARGALVVNAPPGGRRGRGAGAPRRSIPARRAPPVAAPAGAAVPAAQAGARAPAADRRAAGRVQPRSERASRARPSRHSSS